MQWWTNWELQWAEAETRIAILEEKDQSRGVAMDTATKTIARLQEKLRDLEDAGCCNKVHIVEIVEGAEGRDVQSFLLFTEDCSLVFQSSETLICPSSMGREA